MNHHSRFTAIEILIITGTIIALAGGVLIVMKPTQQFARARNAHRQANVSALAEAVAHRLSDNNGEWNPQCGSSQAELPTSLTPIGSEAGSTNLSSCLVPAYLASMPTDPLVGKDTWTGYRIIHTANGKVTVSAPYAELGEDITVTR